MTIAAQPGTLREVADLYGVSAQAVAQWRYQYRQATGTAVANPRGLGRPSGNQPPTIAELDRFVRAFKGDQHPHQVMQCRRQDYQLIKLAVVKRSDRA